MFWQFWPSSGAEANACKISIWVWMCAACASTHLIGWRCSLRHPNFSHTFSARVAGCLKAVSPSFPSPFKQSTDCVELIVWWVAASQRQEAIVVKLITHSRMWPTWLQFFSFCDNMWLSWEDVSLRGNLQCWTLTSWWRCVSTWKSELSVLGRCAPCTSILSKGSSNVSDLWRHETQTCEHQTQRSTHFGWHFQQQWISVVGGPVKRLFQQHEAKELNKGRRLSVSQVDSVLLRNRDKESC